MVEKLKQIKLGVTAGAVMTTIVGILLLLWPDSVIVTLARAIAILVIISGVIYLISKLTEVERNVMTIVVALLIILVGVWMFMCPTFVATLIPMAMGVLMVVHGVQDFSMSLETKSNRGGRWWLIILAAILNIVLGVVCILNAFGVVTFVMQIIGIMLIYDGVSDMFIVHKVNASVKDAVDSSIVSEQDVDEFDEF